MVPSRQTSLLGASETHTTKQYAVNCAKDLRSKMEEILRMVSAQTHYCSLRTSPFGTELHPRTKQIWILNEFSQGSSGSHYRLPSMKDKINGKPYLCIQLLPYKCAQCLS